MIELTVHQYKSVLIHEHYLIQNRYISNQAGRLVEIISWEKLSFKNQDIINFPPESARLHQIWKLSEKKKKGFGFTGVWTRAYWSKVSYAIHYTTNS